MTIEISGLTEVQKIAIEDMLWHWYFFGNIGASRWTAFFADGDGNFRSKIQVDGHKPERQKIIDMKETNREVKISDKKYDSNHISDYAIDFDWLAWKQ